MSSKLGNGLKTAAKIGTAAVGAAATGITALTTAAVNNYAEYEQLVGGVETLYGNAGKSMEQYVQEVADQVRSRGFEPDLEGIAKRWKALESVEQKVLKNASEAYRTSGLSANQYMETITGFTAALSQTIDDKSVVADYADMAVRDMSDNANKMGTSMEMIQNAYQGFAKQNYTMLDNLKLGYGGTKEEMQRLIADAAELSDTVDAQSMSFDNIVEAIHVVQTEMGITGTTAKEAGTTIQGSVASMKSAWTNLLTGLANESANIEQLVDNLVTTIVGDGTESNLGVLGNVLPAVETALNGASALVSKALPKIMEIIPEIINDNLPVLVEAAVGIVQSLMDGISQNQEMLFETIFGVVTYLAESFITMLPQIVELGLDLIVSLANGIAESLPELIPTIVDVVLQIVETLIDNVDMLVDSAIAIMIALSNGLINALPTLIEKAPFIISKLVTALVNNAPKLLEAALTAIQTLVKGLYDNLPEIVNAALQMIDTLVQGLQDLFWKLWDVGVGVVQSIVDGISSVWNDIVSWFNGLWDGLFGNRTANVTVNKTVTGSDVNGSHASGLPYVPFDGYIAELHKGERVLTASEARGYNGGSNYNYDERPIKIIVQSVLDGKVIGETAYNYNRRKARASGA